MAQDSVQLMSMDMLQFQEIFGKDHSHLAQILAEKERVHPIDEKGIIDRRLAFEPDSNGNINNKHCYALIVPVKSEPEVVVYVRLMNRKANNGIVTNEDLTGNINLILDQGSEALDKNRGAANTAIFYTITNMASTKFAKGEKSLGEQLLHHVIGHLNKTYDINVLTTLSPLRVGMGEDAKGFAQWLKNTLDNNPQYPMLTPKEQKVLHVVGRDKKIDGNFDVIQHLHYNPDVMDISEKKLFAHMMKGLGKYYLLEVKSPESDKQILDRVGDFHLSKGAELAHVHYHTASETTKSENIGALGLMANYRYIPELLEQRKASYSSGEIAVDRVINEQHQVRMANISPAGKMVNLNLKPSVSSTGIQPTI